MSCIAVVNELLRSLKMLCAARKYAAAMKAPLIFCSTAMSINVQKLFKIVLSKAFDIKSTIPAIDQIGEPILEY